MSNKFRKGERIAVKTSWTEEPYRLGNVRNPKPDAWGYIKVKLDSDLPGERLSQFQVDAVEHHNGDETQYHLRYYRLWGISAKDIQRLIDAIEAAPIAPDERDKLLRRFTPSDFIPVDRSLL